MQSPRPLAETRTIIRDTMAENSIKGTVILADEGFNATVCGEVGNVRVFVETLEKLLDTQIVFKKSFCEAMPFRKVDVKIKPEIVTLRKDVDLVQAYGTHVPAREWNKLIANEDVVLLDTRNDYEYKNGTFPGAINPRTAKFSELPDFVGDNFNELKNKTIAMFCTGGIRCEKFAPYMKSLGFDNIYQLEGGILKYLEEIAPEESLWEGECFVFDDRRTVDERLEKGVGPDYSQADHCESSK